MSFAFHPCSTGSIQQSYRGRAFEHKMPRKNSRSEVLPIRDMTNGDTAGESTHKASPLPATENAAAFSTTHWSVVLEAAKADSTVSAEALEKLCRIYWYPLYAFARRRGCSPEDAEDLSQGFFEHVIEKES